MEERSTKRNILNILALFFMIVILPGGSWYYLNKGMNYHKTLFAQLKDYGELPEFSLTDQRGRTYTKDSVYNKVILAAFLNSSATDQTILMERLFGLHDQFKHCDSLSILLLPDESTNSKEALLALKEEYKIKGNQPFYCLYGDMEEVKQMKNALHIPDFSKGKNADGKYNLIESTNSSYLVLLNKHNTICNYYDLSDASIKRLVEHMSLIIPRTVRKKPILHREKEK